MATYISRLHNVCDVHELINGFSSDTYTMLVNSKSALWHTCTGHGNNWSLRNYVPKTTTFKATYTNTSVTEQSIIVCMSKGVCAYTRVSAHVHATVGVCKLAPNYMCNSVLFTHHVNNTLCTVLPFCCYSKNVHKVQWQPPQTYLVNGHPNWPCSP